MFKPASSPLAKAKTNSIVLMQGETLASLSSKLMERMSSAWHPCRIHVFKPASKGKEIGNEINREKQDISKSTGVGAKDIAFVAGKDAAGKRCFYGLRPLMKGETGKEPQPFCPPQVAIELCLKAEILRRFNACNEEFFHHGTDIYLAARIKRSKKDDSLFIEGFNPRVLVHKDSVILTLGALKAMCSTPKTALVLSGPESSPGFLAASSIEKGEARFLDARSNDLKSISFKSAEMMGSRLYCLNKVTEFAEEAIFQAGALARRGSFEPTHEAEGQWVGSEQFAQVSGVDLVVVNLLGAPLSSRFMDYISKALESGAPKFDNVLFHGAGASFADQDSWRAMFADAGKCFLCINPGSLEAEEDGSCKVRGQACEPWDAYDQLAQMSIDPKEMDAYTRAKFAALWPKSDAASKFEAMVAIQGLDWTMVKGLAHVPIKADPLDLALRKCAYELSMKCKARSGAFEVPAGLPDGAYQVSRVDRRIFPGSPKRERWTMLSFDFELSQGTLRLLGKTFIADFDAVKRLESKGLGPVSALPHQQGSTRLLDKSNNQLLLCFKGDIVPKIVLNAKYSGIDQALGDQGAHPPSKDDPLVKSKSYARNDAWALLPYYVSPGGGPSWRSKTYLQDMGTHLRYLVPPAEGIKEELKFSNMRDLMVFDSKPAGDAWEISAIAGPLRDNALVKCHIGLLTRDVLLMGGFSKSSLLEKLVKFCGMDS